ncbi:hypothetical protein CORC01_02932 [Colletotrichum orchidophilum]|uniref:Cupin type-2 domain-containing protein n=1 Tax=Colletotrichum orchidophilum TaxID=1209926 RepID=A0A1G4BJY1_9PEZI|nr:uncharacterized protein CORC01_02932 [Colletotrichum orchidophilum]OHF01741.1 hypothetical protein CORC01_02932 [Colletotrichum orchidophilum]
MALKTLEKPLIVDIKSEATKIPEFFSEHSRGNATWHTLVSAPGTLTDSLSSGVATCPPNGSLALHRHKQAEIYYVLSGSGKVEINGVRHNVSKDQLVWIPGDAEHGVFCDGDETMTWLYVFPEGRFSDIVYRFKHEIMGEPEIRAKL